MLAALAGFLPAVVWELTRDLRERNARVAGRRKAALKAFVPAVAPPAAGGPVGLLRVFRTAKLVLIHAASCRFRYSSWTSCGVL